MKVHQEKKQKGEKTGCKINYLRNLRSESSKGSVTMVSSNLSYPTSSITSSQFENLRDNLNLFESDSEVDLVEVKKGGG